MEWYYFFVKLEVVAGRESEMMLKNMVWVKLKDLLINLKTESRWILKVALTKRNQKESPFKEINFLNDFY